MKLFRGIVCLALALFASTGSAWAQVFDDPPNLHIFSSSSFAQSSGGTDWITLPGFDGNFSLLDVSDKQTSVSPFHIVVAIPNQTGALADLITRVGTTDLNVSPGPEIVLTSGSAYDRLGIVGSAIPNSLSFNNFSLADQALGLAAPTSFGLNDFEIDGIGLLAKTALDIKLTGLLPVGSVIFAYGFDNGTLYTTSFTNAGVVGPQSFATPEPATFVSAGIGGALVLAYAAWRRRKSRMTTKSELAITV